MAAFALAQRFQALKTVPNAPEDINTKVLELQSRCEIGDCVEETLPAYWVAEAMNGRSVSLRECVEDWQYHFGDLDAEDDEGWDAAEAILTPWYAEFQAALAVLMEMEVMAFDQVFEYLKTLCIMPEDEPSNSESIIEDSGDPMAMATD